MKKLLILLFPFIVAACHYDDLSSVENLISLPLHTKLSDEDVEYVVENFKEIVRGYVC